MKRLTFSARSGTRSTRCRSGASGRFDFQPRRVQTGATRSSSRPITGRSLRKWFSTTMLPPGLTTRRISRSTATGSGTALIVYVATAESNSSSANSMTVASMARSVTLVAPSSSTFSCALRSISSERSMPVSRQRGG